MCEAIRAHAQALTALWRRSSTPLRVLQVVGALILFPLLPLLLFALVWAWWSQRTVIDPVEQADRRAAAEGATRRAAETQRGEEQQLASQEAQAANEADMAAAKARAERLRELEKDPDTLVEHMRRVGRGDP